MANLYTECDCGAGNDELVHTVGCAATPIRSAWPTIVSRLMKDVVAPLGLDENQQEQFGIYTEAFALFMEREAKYQSLWMQYGAVDSYQHMRSKCARSQFLLEGFTDDQDDPLDLINYSAFFLRNLRAGRIHPAERSPETETVAIALEDIKAGDTVIVDFETGQLRRA